MLNWGLSKYCVPDKLNGGGSARGTEMNPLLWKREHQHAWVIVSLSGAIAGLLLGFIHSPYFAVLGTWQAFVVWLSHSASYWPWPLFGLLITGLTFYGVQLFRSSN